MSIVLNIQMADQRCGINGSQYPINLDDGFG
jgi:hypothetical protein